jgi:hypothetical protein
MQSPSCFAKNVKMPHAVRKLCLSRTLDVLRRESCHSALHMYPMFDCAHKDYVDKRVINGSTKYLVQDHEMTCSDVFFRY